MAVSKRLRYEILRRDHFTCRYCGTSAPWVRLEVDHVVPRSRGGPDIAGNLVTSCEDCNDGKGATLPDGWLREEIEQAALEWGCDPKLPDTAEDDAFAMALYQEALYALRDLPGDEILYWIAKTYAAAMPYKPTHEELIRCAGLMAKRERSGDAH